MNMLRIALLAMMISCNTIEKEDTSHMWWIPSNKFDCSKCYVWCKCLPEEYRCKCKLWEKEDE